ncbi:MAG: helicase-related protein [Gemmatimonadales bacterium]
MVALTGLLQRRYGLAKPPLSINGDVAGPLRLQRVNRFQARSGFDVMLLSPRAGGVGLTLTAANHVIHLSRWWNPAVEDQCTDRAFRIGQVNTVTVHYPLARHPQFDQYSFDLRLDEVLVARRVLSKEVLAPTAFSRDDVKRLFRETVEQRGP